MGFGGRPSPAASTAYYRAEHRKGATMTRRYGTWIAVAVLAALVVLAIVIAMASGGGGGAGGY